MASIFSNAPNPFAEDILAEIDSYERRIVQLKQRVSELPAKQWRDKEKYEAYCKSQGR